MVEFSAVLSGPKVCLPRTTQLRLKDVSGASRSGSMLTLRSSIASNFELELIGEPKPTRIPRESHRFERNANRPVWTGV